MHSNVALVLNVSYSQDCFLRWRKNGILLILPDPSYHHPQANMGQRSKTTWCTNICRWTISQPYLQDLQLGSMTVLHRGDDYA